MKDELNDLRRENNSSRRSRREGNSRFDQGPRDDDKHSYSQSSRHEKDSRYSDGRGSAKREG